MARKKVFDGLNVYLADLLIVYVKIHDLHFNVEGSGFKNIHKYFEKLYEFIHDVYDESAETAKMYGEFPLVKVSEYVKISHIKELPSRPFSIKEACKIAVDDLVHLKNEAIALRSIAEDWNENDNFIIINKLEDHVAEYSKYIWFLKSYYSEE